MKSRFLSAAVFASFLFIGISNTSYSQYDPETGMKIEIPIPDFPIVIGDETYDKEGYDQYGYDRYGYDREGYDRSGYNRKGYDRSGYDRSGYDIYGYDKNGYDRKGNYRNTTGEYYEKEKNKDQTDNGKHKGWYKTKHKNKKHNDDDNGSTNKHDWED